MALLAVDLLTPRGRLNGAALWPGVATPDVESSLGEFLADGYTRVAAEGITGTDQDAPARLWAYHRAYTEASDRLLLMPTSVTSSDEGSASYDMRQITALQELAAQMLAEYEALVDELTAVDTGAYGVIRSYR